MSNYDSHGRRPPSWAHRSRGNTRSTSHSARSSAIFDDGSSSSRSPAVYSNDHLHPYGQQHGRPSESRFSLNENFAATRREYDFDDDASSVFERLTIASGAGPGLDLDLDPDKSGLVDLVPAVVPTVQGVRNYYELLCLSPGLATTSDRIRDAYYRLFWLLRSEMSSPQQKAVAEFYFHLVQSAFETLIDPRRRAEYDELVAELDQFDPEWVSTTNNDDRSVAPICGRPSYAAGLDDSSPSGFDLRVDMTKFKANGQRNRTARPLDVAIGHEIVKIRLPALGAFAEGSINSLRGASGATGISRTTTKSTPATAHYIRLGVPVLSVSGSVYGSLGTLIFSRRYLRSGGVSGGRRHAGSYHSHLAHCQDFNLLPLLSVKLRQDVFQDAIGHEFEPSAAPPTSVELQYDILPSPCVDVRVMHTIGSRRFGSTYVSIGATKPLFAAPKWPAIDFAASKPFRYGQFFVRSDGGDWNYWPATCRTLTEFAKVINDSSFDQFDLQAGPQAEFGFSSQAGPIHSESVSVKPRAGTNRHLGDILAPKPDEGWTAAILFSLDSAKASLGYGSNVDFPIPWRRASRPRTAGLRLEVEASATTRADNGYMAIRTLKRFGRVTNCGLELGMSSSGIRMALHWSRRGRRITIPFLAASGAQLLTKIPFWVTVTPYLGLAALQYFQRRRSRRQHPSDLSNEALQDYIAKRRAEADELTMLLAGAVEPRQRFERASGGLVILSAKFGVKDPVGQGWADEEVADVTIAVAALVDNSTILIPRGVRKSHLLGFWDPAPMQTKALVVWYSYRGKESAVEVRGREELKLPLDAHILAVEEKTSRH